MTELTWTRTGDLRSRNHLAISEPYITHALCGVGVEHAGEIRPRLSHTWCDRCVREARKLGIEAAEVGIENDLTINESAATREP